MINKMEMNIKFKDGKTTTFLGRNGGFKCKGISVFKSSAETILIEPITSKGKIGRSMIEIPIDDVDQFIKALNKVRIN